MIWVLFAFLTGAAVLAVLWPLMRAPRPSVRQAADRGFYQTAISGIDRDLERGLTTPGDAEAARVEAARRLIASAASAPAQSASRPRLRIAALAAVVLIPALTLGLYYYTGNPDYSDQPLAARLHAPPDGMDVNAALAKIERHLADNPDDARGWEIVAPVYMKLGRADDAAEAFRQQIRLLGPSAPRASAYGEALTYAAGGQVSPAARAAFEAALKEDASWPQARFFLALALEQAGDRPRAIEAFTRLLNDTPADAPWLDIVRERIAKLEGAPEAAQADAPPNQAAAIAAMPAGERDQAIRGMVAGLAARLAQNGGDIEGWLRLVRAYTVLREPDKARAALADARKAMTSDAGAIDKLDMLARELGIGG